MTGNVRFASFLTRFTGVRGSAGTGVEALRRGALKHRTPPTLLSRSDTVEGPTCGHGVRTEAPFRTITESASPEMRLKILQVFIG